MPRLVVFDVDGTLVDSQRHIHGAMTDAFLHEGFVPPSLADTLRIVGLSLPVAMARLAPEFPQDAIDRLIHAYKDSFATRRAEEDAPFYPGALAALDRLGQRGDIRLGIATGKSRRGLDHVLRAHDLHGRFVTVQVADDHPSKPHPSMLLAALAETGADPRYAVMIGDTTYDMAMARAAGVAGIGVAWGYHDEPDLRAAGADCIATAFDEIDALIDGIRVPA